MNGFLFYKNGGKIELDETAYWRCKKCAARAITRGDAGHLELIKIADDSDHFHAQNSGTTIKFVYSNVEKKHHIFAFFVFNFCFQHLCFTKCFFY